jgi:hypothetical protein
MEPDFDQPEGGKKGTVPICAKHPPGRSGKWGLSPFSRPPSVAGQEQLQQVEVDVSGVDGAVEGVGVGDPQRVHAGAEAAGERPLHAGQRPPQKLAAEYR